VNTALLQRWYDGMKVEHGETARPSFISERVKGFFAAGSSPGPYLPAT
jgi:hypothetical protein